MRVQAYAKLNGQPVSTSLAAEALQKLKRCSTNQRAVDRDDPRESC